MTTGSPRLSTLGCQEQSLAVADVNAIDEVLLRVFRMVEEIPEIRELDLNPKR